MRTKFLILILLLKFNILLYSQDERKWEVYPDIFFSTGQLTSPIAFAIGTNIYCGGGLYGVNNLGGNSIEVYNILQKRIVTTIGTPYGNTAYAVTFTINGKGYVCMGSKLSPSERIVKQLWELDTASNIWTRKADFPGTLGGKTAAVSFVINNKAYIGTGVDSTTQQVSNDFWEYNPSLNQWTRKADFPGEARAYASGFSIGSKGYIGTGISGQSNPLSDFYEYDPSTNLWTRKADFPGKRYYAVGFSITGFGYIATGRDTTVSNPSLYQYNPISNSWLPKATYGPLVNGRAVTINDTAYVGLGQTSGGSSTNFDGLAAYKCYIPTITLLENACANNAASLTTTGPPDKSLITTYNWSNGIHNSIMQTTIGGNYNVNLITKYGCNVTSPNFTLVPINNCAGVVEVESDSVKNYFDDTITVTIRVKNADNMFSFFGKLNFESSKLKLLSSQTGNFLGNNIINSPPVITGNIIDFGLSKTNGQSGSFGNGILYTFKFKLIQFPFLIFDTINPTRSNTIFKITNELVNDANGDLRNIRLKPDTTVLRYSFKVWPGDLDNNKTVNVSDILPIGYFYNSTGSTRPNATLAWRGQYAGLWGYNNNTNFSDAYKVFADGNGNGIIDLGDQNSIGFNLGKIHARYKPEDYIERIVEENLVDVPLDVVITDTFIPRAQLPKNITVRINLGTSSQPFSSIYGIAFDLYYNPNFVDGNNITLDYSNNVFGTLNSDYIKIEDKNTQAGRIGIGLTRYNTTEISGSGKVVDVTFPIKLSGPSNYFRVVANPLSANNKAGVPTPIGSGIDSVRVDQLITSIKESSKNFTITKVYPNPTEDEITIKISSNLSAKVDVKIYDIEGNELFNKKSFFYRGDINETIKVDTFPKGNYIITFSSNNEIIATKFQIK